MAQDPHSHRDEGRVSRTASGNYELTPATAGSVQARPHPKEPR